AADHARMLQSIAAIGQLPPAFRAPAPAQAPAPAFRPLDLDVAVRQWALTLPNDTPGKRKSSKSSVSKVQAFAAWKRAKTGGASLVSDASRTDFGEYFVACKNRTTKRGGPPAPR